MRELALKSNGLCCRVWPGKLRDEVLECKLHRRIPVWIRASASSHRPLSSGIPRPGNGPLSAVALGSGPGLERNEKVQVLVK